MLPCRTTPCIAFDGHKRIAHGALRDVVRTAKTALEAGAKGPLLLFDERDSHPLEIDFRGSVDEVLARLSPEVAAAPASRGPAGGTRCPRP